MSYTVRLMRNPDNIGVTGATKAGSLATQSAYFDGLEHVDYETPTFVVGTPIRVVASSVQQVMSYPYGYINVDGFRWYFVVVSVSMISKNLIEIDYQIDAYETAQHQLNLHIRRATVRRIGHVMTNGQTDVTVIEPYTPRDIVQVFKVRTSSVIMMFTYRKQDKMYNGFIVPATPTALQKTDFVRAVCTGEWLGAYASTLSIQESDVWFAGVVFSDIVPAELTTAGWLFQSTEGGYSLYVDGVPESSTSPASPFTKDYDTPLQLYNNVYEWIELDDTRGNCLFKAPPYMPAYVSSVTADFTASSASLRYEVGYSGSSGSRIVSVSAEPVDLFVDSYKEYLYRQRDADLRLRQISMDQSAVQGIANIGQSAIGGALAGSLVPGIGTVAGALAGTAVSVGGILGSSVISSHYGKEAQQATDDMYRRTLDTMTQAGAVGAGLLQDWAPHHFVKKRWEPATMQQYLDDVNTNGYYVNAYFPDFDAYEGLTGGPITMDCEVLGNIPALWANSISERFAQGIKVKTV